MAELFAADVIAQAGPPVLVRAPHGMTYWVLFSYTPSDGGRWRLSPIPFLSAEAAEKYGRKELTAVWSHFVVAKVDLPGITYPPTPAAE